MMPIEYTRAAWLSIAARAADAYPADSRADLAEFIESISDGDRYLHALGEVLRDAVPRRRNPSHARTTAQIWN